MADVTFPPTTAPSPLPRTGSSADLAGPIRAGYESDDGEDEAELEYVRSKLQSRTRSRHQSTPSTSALLTPDEEATGTEEADAATSLPRQERLRQYDLEAGDEGRRSLRWLRPISDRLGGGVAFVKRNEGFLLIALAQCLFAAINTCVKLLQDLVDIPVWELIAIRMAVTWVGCVSYMRWAKTPHPFLGPPGVRIWLCARGVIGFGGLFGMYNSLKYLSLSDATVLSFISPVLVGVLAAILLKEKYTKAEALTGVLSLGGVVLIAKPTFLFGKSVGETFGPEDIAVTPEQRSMAVWTAMVGVVCSAGAYLVIRYIGKRANALHSISYFSLYSVVVSCLYAFIVESRPVLIWDYRFFLLLTPIGILGFAAQALLTTGLQREKAGRGTLAVYSLLLFSTIFERLVFGKLPDAWSLVGSVIIIGGALYVVVQKRGDEVAKGPVRKAAIVSVPREDIDEGKLEEGRSEEEDGEEEEDERAWSMPSLSGTGER